MGRSYSLSLGVLALLFCRDRRAAPKPRTRAPSFASALVIRPARRFRTPSSPSCAACTTIIARATTDAAGQRNAHRSRRATDSTDLSGRHAQDRLPRSDRFFRVGPARHGERRSSSSPRDVDASPPVKVRAEPISGEELPPRRRRHREQRLRLSPTAWDVVKRLRPDMLRSRGGCERGVQEVGSTAKRNRIAAAADGNGASARVRRRAAGHAHSRIHPGVRAVRHRARAHPGDGVPRLLRSHRWRLSAASNALFVTLKPGVAFQEDVGSFVVDSSTDNENQFALMRR